MNIKVKLEGSSVTIDPNPYTVKHGRKEIKWKQKDKSDQFDFDDPPITFDDPHAPMSGLAPDGNTATCTDDNQNDSGQDRDYGYHVHLIDANGKHITYPPMESPKADGNPTIKNRPK